MPTETKVIRVTARYTAERRTILNNGNIYCRITNVSSLPGPREHITIVTRRDEDGHWEAAEVTWCSFRATGPEEVTEFAKALAWAAKEAVRFDTLSGLRQKKSPESIPRGTSESQG